MMDKYLAELPTENSNSATEKIDCCSTKAMLEMINDEDQQVAQCVRDQIPSIASAVDAAYNALSHGGRLFYFGAGTSGRIGVLDASECPPTFSTDPSLVQAFIAGGDKALRSAVEGCEDDDAAGRSIVQQAGVTAKDIAVGISASGSAAFVIAAMQAATEAGALTVAVVTNKNTKLASVCNIAIEPLVGSEVLIGSTRMKSGTAQKLVLNMLTTGTMIKLGKVYRNLMVDISPTNKKLVERAKRIIMEACGVTYDVATDALERNEHNVKRAIVNVMTGLHSEASQQELTLASGKISVVLEKYCV